MSELVISGVSSTELTYQIRGLSYNFNTAHYVAIGLTTGTVSSGATVEPGGTISASRYTNIPSSGGGTYTQEITISHGLNAGSYTLQAWVQVPSDLKYYPAGVASVTVPSSGGGSEDYYYYGGYGGGAAVGSDGGDGLGTKNDQDGGDGATATIAGTDAVYGTNAQGYYGYGNGGNGGHGGGGGGAGGYNTKRGGDPGGSGGSGSAGGAGAPGCIIIYYGTRS